MVYQTIPLSFDKNTYNAVVHHPLQSWEWGAARVETGVGVIRIGEYDHDTLHNVFTMTIHPVPHIPYRIGYIPRSVLPKTELLDFLNEYGKKNNLIFIKFEPYVEKNAGNETMKQWDKLTISQHPLFPVWTQMLDLTKTENELLDGMKPKTRYNIRYAQKQGVVVKEQSTDEGFAVFCDLYFKTTGRQDYHGHTPSYHKIIWNHLKEKIAHILIAYHEETPLAAYELLQFQDRWYYPYGGSSTEKRNLMGSNLLMWEAIRLGKKLGAHTFDMWGSLPPDYDHEDPWAGFTRFKEGYGTTFVEFVGSFDLVINPLLYPLYNLAYKIRQKIL